MIKFENTAVYGWVEAVRGMRNPKNSWAKSDSEWDWVDDPSPIDPDAPGMFFKIGERDMKLMQALRNSGSDHRKFLRMITVYVDITAPLYWWKEFDTYKIGTVANSCSTMHKIADKEFTLDDFSHEHLINEYSGDDDWESEWLDDLRTTICRLNRARKRYLEAKVKPMKDESRRAENMKKYWWQMIQLLPSSYNQRRTVMLNYEVLNNICRTGRRLDHKLDEWRVGFMDWARGLPYANELIFGQEVS